MQNPSRADALWLDDTAMDALEHLQLNGDYYMIAQNSSDGSFLHPRGVTDTAKYPEPKLIQRNRTRL